MYVELGPRDATNISRSAKGIESPEQKSQAFVNHQIWVLGIKMWSPSKVVQAFSLGHLQSHSASFSFHPLSKLFIPIQSIFNEKEYGL